MASDIWLRTILIVRKETRCCHIGYSYRLTARVLLYAPSHRQDNTYNGLCYTSRGALAGTRSSSMGPPHEGSIRRPIAPWANALPLSYVPLRESVWMLDLFPGLPAAVGSLSVGRSVDVAARREGQCWPESRAQESRACQEGGGGADTGRGTPRGAQVTLVQQANQFFRCGTTQFSVCVNWGFNYINCSVCNTNMNSNYKMILKRYSLGSALGEIKQK